MCRGAGNEEDPFSNPRFCSRNWSQAEEEEEEEEEEVVEDDGFQL